MLDGESLAKAHDSAALARAELRAALSKADALEAMLLLPLIGEVTEFGQRVASLLAAVDVAVLERQESGDL